MRQMLTAAAAALALAALTAPAQAGGKPGGHPGHGGGHGGVKAGRGHERQFTGQQHGGHYRFHGREGHSWSRTRWWGRYGCETYYCPTTLAWYYWCAPQACYLPVALVAQYPPAPAAAPVVAPAPPAPVPAPQAAMTATATATATAVAR